MGKPSDLEEIRNFIRNKLIEEYGDAVTSGKESNQIIVDTETKYYGNSDVWIGFCYFH